jgi:hypothetical protein
MLTVTRIYTGSDGNMIAKCRTIHSIFLTEVGAFTNFDTTLDVAFGALWLQQIDAAETVVRDSTIIDQQVALTDSVLACMEDCKQKYGDVRFFVRKAFPKNRSILNEFGNNDYRNAQRNQGKMVLFMDGLLKAATKYTSQLIAKGLSQTEIDEIETKGKALRDANVAQEALKRGRPVLTDDRIEVLNTCYSTSLMVSEAAQRVFVGNASKIKQYKITTSTNKVLKTKTGSIAPGATVVVGVLPTGALSMNIENKGNAGIETGLSIDQINFDGNTSTLANIGKEKIIIADLASNGNVVIIRNQSTTEVASYKIEILG